MMLYCTACNHRSVQEHGPDEHGEDYIELREISLCPVCGNNEWRSNNIGYTGPTTMRFTSEGINHF